MPLKELHVGLEALQHGSVTYCLALAQCA
jgi:hypothetical protein